MPSKLEAKHNTYAHDTETTYPNAPCLMSLNSSENKGGPDRESHTEGRLVSPCGDPLKIFFGNHMIFA